MDFQSIVVDRVHLRENFHWIVCAHGDIRVDSGDSSLQPAPRVGYAAVKDTVRCLPVRPCMQTGIHHILRALSNLGSIREDPTRSMLAMLLY